MRKVLLIGVLFAVAAVIGWSTLESSQDELGRPQLKLVDTGWLDDGSLGEGVYMVFKAKILPPDGMNSIEPTLLSLCNQMVGTVVPYVLEKTGRKDPAYIMITVKYGGIIGTYGKWKLPYKDGKCST